MSADRAAAANVLGAVALAVADQVQVRVTPAGGRSDSAAAALSALYHFPGRLTVDQLCQVLGLTHSGAVRLVDRLAGAGLVERAPGADRRSRSVRLTAAGRRAAHRVSDRRIAYLTSLLAGFSAAEKRALHELLGRVMGQVVDHKRGGAWICRMCHLQACGRAAGNCPAANAAALRYGTTHRDGSATVIPDGDPGPLQAART
ncbi:MAG TPA: MarR family transcriptional regulator [Streptosporangiaceae bacterium]|nr:MarR family transcriptional regulator [Streptosporangiaceae bacterium]